MSAITNETVQQQLPTAELYVFFYNGATYNYTSHQENLRDTDNNTTFTAIPIKRSDYSLSVGAPVSTMRIDVYFKGTIFESLRSINNPTIDVWVGKALTSDINDNYIFYKGKIKKIQYERQVAQLECVSGGYELERTIPTPKYQELCNNVLFDNTCSLLRSDFEIKARVTAIDNNQTLYGRGSNITLENYSPDFFGNNFTDKTSAYFNYGTISINNEYSMIIYVNSPVIQTLFRMSNNLQVGDIISIYPGCNKKAATCVDTFDNLTNFVGFPYMPSLDPAKWGIEVL